MKRRIARRLGACALAAACCGAGAQEQELDAVVVTAPAAAGLLRSVPHGISVITAQDIERSTAVNLPELLAHEAGINLRSFFGGRSRSRVDIRGMGDTAGSNVLVLLDGVPLNEVDMSGADLGAIDLAQVERIEVLRGGGAVRYGNGAVAGVVNILTRTPRRGERSGAVALALGSRDKRSLSARVAQGFGDWALSAVAASHDSDGWRRNGGERARDASVNLTWMPASLGPLTDVYLRATHHRDRVGLPGPVSAEAFAAGQAQRRDSDAPFDHSRAEVSRLTLGSHADFDTAGRLHWMATAYERRNPYLMGYTPLEPASRQGGRIESSRQQWELRYDLDFGPADHGHTLSLGAFGRQARFEREDDGHEVVGSERQRGRVREGGWFAETRWALGRALQLQAGLRRDRFRTQRLQDRYANGGCQYETRIENIDIDPGPGVILVPVPVQVLLGCSGPGWSTPARQGGNWANRAAELGLTWQVTPAHTVFTSLSRHYRAPNIDELARASADLTPQTGRTWELGWRWQGGPRTTLSLTAFEIRNDSEIYFAEDDNENRNYGRATRRRGLEVETRLPLHPRLTLHASAGYVQPRFAGVGQDVPLVPRTTAALELDWEAARDMHALFALRHAGRRRDGNDSAATPYPSLPAYTVCDLGWRWKLGQVDLAAGITNLFDRVYSTLGYSATYYPMPGRSWTASATWRF